MLFFYFLIMFLVSGDIMHTDERAEFREEFLTFFNEKYWFFYEKNEKKVRFLVNGFFRVLHVLVLVSVLGIAFASVRDYIPRKWWILSVILAIFWIAIEYINLNRMDNWLLRKTYKKLFDDLNQDEKFLEYLKTFEQKDISPPGFSTYLIQALNIQTAPNGIEKIRQLLYYLQAVKSFDEQEHEIHTEYNTHVPPRDNMFD